MQQFRTRKRYSVVVTLMIAFIIALMGVFFASFGNPELSGIIVLVFVIILCYYSVFTKILKSTDYCSVLCDSRFYIFSAMLLYSILPPIYCMLTLGEYGGARVRTAYNATIYTTDELLKSVLMSTLLFVGIYIGFSIREHTKDYNRFCSLYNEKKDSNTGKKFFGWLIVCFVSTLLFYLPFIRGGFQVIRLGGTILDVDRSNAGGFVGRIQEIFFSSEIMTASTIAMLYYAYRLNISQRSRRIILSITLAFQIVGALMTTRRARAFSIILCAFVIYIYWYEKKKNKLPWTQIVIASFAIGFLYLLEVIMGQRQANGGIAGYIRLFDGISAYDSLLRSTRELPSISMLSNIVYGIFRPIPVFGKYIIEFIGLPTDASPLYHWMAERYATYQLGGGLAYTPQLEAYLTFGYFGCLLFGIIYGLVFGKKRSGLVNLFVIAISFSVARGTLQVILSLIWPFGIIGYLFYDQILFSRIRFGSGKTEKDSILMNPQKEVD